MRLDLSNDPDTVLSEVSNLMILTQVEKEALGKYIKNAEEALWEDAEEAGGGCFWCCGGGDERAETLSQLRDFT